MTGVGFTREQMGSERFAALRIKEFLSTRWHPRATSDHDNQAASLVSLIAQILPGADCNTIFLATALMRRKAADFNDLKGAIMDLLTSYCDSAEYHKLIDSLSLTPQETQWISEDSVTQYLASVET